MLGCPKGQEFRQGNEVGRAAERCLRLDDVVETADRDEGPVEVALRTTRPQFLVPAKHPVKVRWQPDNDVEVSCIRAPRRYFEFVNVVASKGNGIRSAWSGGPLGSPTASSPKRRNRCNGSLIGTDSLTRGALASGLTLGQSLLVRPRQ